MKHLIKHIGQEIIKNFLDYLILITGGIFFLIFLRMFRGEKTASFVIILIFVSTYIIWGAYHHVSDKSVHLKNLIEYIIIGFTIILLLMLIFSY